MMKPTSAHPMNHVPGLQIGIPVRAARSVGGATIETRDLEQFERAELNLQRALETVGLCLEPLGYMQGSRAHYRVFASDTTLIAVGDLDGGAIQATLSALIDRARRGDVDKTRPAETGTSAGEGGGLQRVESTAGTVHTSSGAPESCDTEQNKDKPDVADGVASPMGAPSTDDGADMEDLRRYIQQGPDDITVDGEVRPWASAVPSSAATTGKARGLVTLHVTGAERHLRDRQGNRIRPPGTSDDIDVGTTVEIGGIHTEHALVVTISDQHELDFEHGDGGDDGRDDD